MLSSLSLALSVMTIFLMTAAIATKGPLPLPTMVMLDCVAAAYDIEEYNDRA